MNKFEILRAIDLFVMGVLVLKSNPNHYVSEVRELAEIWKMEVTKLNHLIKRIKRGENASNVLVDHSIAGTPGKVLTLIKNAIDGTLQSNQWEVVKGRFQRIQSFDPYSF